MKLSRVQKILVGLVASLIVFWIILAFVGTKTSFSNYFFTCLLNLVPLIGGIAAVSSIGAWDKDHSLIRKGMFFIGLGLIFWACGGFIWSYYNFFLNAAAPYPSLADFGFGPSEFFYAIGAIYLARGVGADIAMQKKRLWLFIGLVSVVMFVASYYILIIFARNGVLFEPAGGPLKTFLDLAYPFGDFVSVTISVTLSALYLKYLSEQYRAGMIAVICGLATLFAADASFSYLTNQNTYYNGNSSDLLFLLGLFLLSFGVLSFSDISTEEK